MTAGGPVPPGTTIFEEMSALAARHGAINLGQGFPDAAGPDSVRQAAARFVADGPHHYPRMRGVPELRQALARFYAETQGLAFDPETEIVVTSGATEALAAAILALVAPGDEVILLAPAYDAYAPLVRRAGGRPVEVQLAPPGWTVTAEALRRAVSGATRALVLNDPVNPTGRRLGAAEREAIAAVARAHDLLVIADEVWEEVRPVGSAHVSVASLPGMRARTVKIGSAGKIFQLTGWKVGWMLADAPLADRLAATHQYLTFTTPPALQLAVAEGLVRERAWLEAMRRETADGRARLAEGLAAAGWAVLPSDATWFLCVDLRASGIALDDRAAARLLVEAHGVASVPVSAFFTGPEPPGHVLRFCHAKAPATIDAALARLARARSTLARESERPKSG
ncbi:aminotransferase [Thermaurantiacus tibetensis]|uniref:aminotransferase n=1 Tax=Thermaurantiacus tibetensis TaxID=2759035 RepID=UPI002E2C0C46|nr:aminotransferase [Thermaurantiacus tibetensis]